MLAETQVSVVETSPTALVVVKAAMAEITSVERRAHDRMAELALRFVERGFCLHILRRLLRRQIRIAVQLGELHLRVLLQENQRRLCRLKRAARLVEHLRRDGVGLRQRQVAIIGDLG
jgi:hypothetical protein